MHTFRFGQMGAVAMVLLVTSCAKDEPAVTTSRIIDIEMTDFAFSPQRVTVEVGEIVTFRFTNNGTEPHEAVIGDEEKQADHARQMREYYEELEASTTISLRQTHEIAHPGMNDPFAVSVLPGQVGEITVSFPQAGLLKIGCHEPGHYESGMVSDLVVED